MTKKKETALSNTKIAIIFFTFLAVVVVISIMFKMILLVREGKFDDSRRFTLTISNKQKLEVLSLSLTQKAITVFKLPNINQKDAGKFLEIPIDGVISSDALDLNQTVNSIFLKAILNYSNLKTDLTIIDLLKLFFLTKAIPQAAINERNISLDLSGGDADKIVGRLVGDELITKDNKTIQIINGTKVQGFGNRLARLITNMGGNVIIVATSDAPHKRSTISYIGQKTYTVERLHKILGYDIINTVDNALSDIAITIGEDRVNSAPF